MRALLKPDLSSVPLCFDELRELMLVLRPLLLPLPGDLVHLGLVGLHELLCLFTACFGLQLRLV